VPSSLHYPIARDFLKRGVHVLVEKPITVDTLQAQRLIDLAAKQGLVLQVGHLERFNPALIELRKRIRRPLMLETHRLGPRTNRNLDVGIIWDLMIHDLDIALNIVQAPVVDVSAVGHRLYSKQEDLASVRLFFQNGCVAHLVASRISGEKARTLRVMEADCTWNLDFMNQTLTRFEAGQTTGQPIEVAKAEPLRLELEHFVDCVLHRREPEVSGDDGRRAVELALQATQRMQRVEQDGRGDLIAVAG
ncbi:MAG: Gfo/Idh/MocA family oxidoreductase, partial [Candidatus Xenobia bacterium]